MNASEAVITGLSFISLIPTLASLTKFDKWWIRGFDFPRIQISFLNALFLGLGLLIYSFEANLHYVITGLLIVSLIYQAVKIFPYTILAQKQVMRAKNQKPENTIAILVSNVLTSNKRSDKLKARVWKEKPDLVLTLETDQRWEKELSEIEDQYPYTVKIPQDNLYGMHLFSKLELEDIKVKHLISDEIPSIHGYVKLRSGESIRIHCLHPKPPSPTESPTSTNRDAELLIVGQEIDTKENSILVFGDLNDVAWSRTTRLFQKISGLMDPRIGRGFYNTFHTKYPILRWPLDHIFHTVDFTLIDLRRLKSIGSDHFPIFIKLNYEPRAVKKQEKPEDADGDEKEWAEEKVQKGDPKSRNVNP